MRGKRIIGLVLIAGLAGLVPFCLIARSRALRSPTPAIHLVLDMVAQPKFKTQRENPIFADGRAMRPRIDGTMAQEDMAASLGVSVDPVNVHAIDGEANTLQLTDEAQYNRVMLGQEMGPDGKAVFVAKIPVHVTLDLVKRGQERFAIYCAPCHGLSGYGDGSVARTAAAYQEAGNADAAGLWTKPTSYHTDEMRKQPDGHFYNVITNGIRNMPRYDKQIPVIDRWAIVAYVRALQLSQHGSVQDVPADQKDAVR